MYVSTLTYKLSVFLLQVLRELPCEIADGIHPLCAFGVTARVNQILDVMTSLGVDPKASAVCGRLTLIKA